MRCKPPFRASISFASRPATIIPAYRSAQQEAYINSLTARGIVVEVEDHAYPSPPPYTGQQLADESAWYAKIAGDMKTNPYVWFGTMNEPHTDYGAAEAAISAQEQATYQAIRGAGNNAPIMMELLGGGNPGTIGAGAGMTASTYANMTNIVWDLHYYGWAAGNNPGQTLQTLIGQAQTIQSRDGIVPVIVGEFGNSTTGNGIDGNGQAVVQAVVDAGRNGIGSAAWKWGTGGGGGGDGLQNGDGSLSAFGNTVAQFTKAAAPAAASSHRSRSCQPSPRRRRSPPRCPCPTSPGSPRKAHPIRRMTSTDRRTARR